jgi:hypothetical protein
MGGPGWLTDIFAALMLTVALYCASRLVVARWWRRPTELDTDGAHVVMGVAMAGMLVTGLRSLPATLWEAVFAVGAGWFGWRMLQARRGVPPGSWRCLHPVPHLVECVAMLYMFLLLPASIAVRGPTGAMGGLGVSAPESRFSFLALVLALFMFGYVAWVGDRLTLRAPALALASAGQAPVAPAVNSAAVNSAAANSAEVNSAAADGPGTGESASAGHTTPSGCGGAAVAAGRAYLAPRCAALCKIAMGVTMGYLLILML